MPQTTHPRTQGVGLIGQLDDTSPLKNVESLLHGDDVALDGTSEAEFGCLMVRGAAAGQFLKPAAQANVPVGVLVRSDSYNKDNELGTVGLKEQVMGAIATRGRVRVKVEETISEANVLANAAVRYRAVTTTGESAGVFRTSDPTGTDTVAITEGARWVEAGTAATGAVLEFDVLNFTLASDS